MARRWVGLTGGGVAVQKSAFEVASDAFNTFKRLLTHHDAVGEFLQEHHCHFFKLYEQLLQSKNYATQRQVCAPRPTPPAARVTTRSLLCDENMILCAVVAAGGAAHAAGAAIPCSQWVYRGPRQPHEYSARAGERRASCTM